MPYKSDKTKLPTGKNRRVKLTQEQRDEIAANVGGLSQRALARKYGVSRRTITFILDPDKLRENPQRRKERGGSQRYYHTQTHTDSVRLHRRYKHILSRRPNATLCDQCYQKVRISTDQPVWATSVPIKNLTHQ